MSRDHGLSLDTWSHTKLVEDDSFKNMMQYTIHSNKARPETASGIPVMEALLSSTDYSGESVPRFFAPIFHNSKCPAGPNVCKHCQAFGSAEPAYIDKHSLSSEFFCQHCSNKPKNLRMSPIFDFNSTEHYDGTSQAQDPKGLLRDPVLAYYTATMTSADINTAGL